MYTFKFASHRAAACQVRVYDDMPELVYVLQSYNTDVAMVKYRNNQLIAMYTGKYSVTTSKHMSWFINFLKINYPGLYCATGKIDEMDLYANCYAINLTTGEVYKLPPELINAASSCRKYNSTFLDREVKDFITKI